MSNFKKWYQQPYASAIMQISNPTLQRASISAHQQLSTLTNKKNYVSNL
jgi:hypothetical protein